MNPVTFARLYNIKFCARYVRSGDYGRQHYRAVLTNRTNGKRISIEYSPSPMNNPTSNMQARRQAIEAALTWIQHCADSLYWHERDEQEANRYSDWTPARKRIPYSSPEERKYCKDGRIYRAWIDNADTWRLLVNGIVETE